MAEADDYVRRFGLLLYAICGLSGVASLAAAAIWKRAVLTLLILGAVLLAVGWRGLLNVRRGQNLSRWM